MPSDISQVEHDLLISFLAGELVPNITAEEIKTLEDTIKPLLPQITLVDLSPLGAAVSDASLSYIAQNVGSGGTVPKIQVLMLAGCTHIDGGGFSQFAALPQLKIVNAAGMPSLKDSSANRLLSSVAGNELEVLILNGNGQLTDQVLADLPVEKLCNIIEIDLSGTRITDATFAVLAQMPDLATVMADGCRGFSASALDKLKTLEKLQSLSLGYNLQIDDGALLSLIDGGSNSSPILQSLAFVNLNNCHQVTDAGITGLLTDSKLTGLALAYTQITDKSIQMILGLEELSFLDVSGCRRISASGIEVVRDKFPQADIVM